MNEKEMMQKFDELYGLMSKSTDTDDMKVFGRVLREAMVYLSSTRPDKAEEFLEELCAIKWDNYLTRKEADAIVKGMQPSAKWSYDQVVRGLEALGYGVEEVPYYNSCALYVTINMKYSDSGRTLAEKVMKTDLADVDDMVMLDVCYHLALDVLKDKDGVFNIRKYFGLQ